MNNPSRRHFLEGAAATIAGAAVLSSGTAEAAAKKGSKGTASLKTERLREVPLL